MGYIREAHVPVFGQEQPQATHIAPATGEQQKAVVHHLDALVAKPDFSYGDIPTVARNIILLVGGIRYPDTAIAQFSSDNPRLDITVYYDTDIPDTGARVVVEHRHPKEDGTYGIPQREHLTYRPQTFGNKRRDELPVMSVYRKLDTPVRVDAFMTEKTEGHIYDLPPIERPLSPREAQGVFQKVVSAAKQQVGIEIPQA